MPYRTIYEATNPISGNPVRLRFNGLRLLRQEDYGTGWRTTEAHELSGPQTASLESAIAADDVAGWLDSSAADLY